MDEDKFLFRSRVSKNAALLLSSLLALGVVACSSDSAETSPIDDRADAGNDVDTEDPSPARIEVTPAQASVVERRTVQLAAKAFDTEDAEMDGITITWASSDEQLATVDEAGLVSSLRPGEVTIVASASGKSASATITITEAAVASLELGADKDEVSVDGSIKLIATAKDEDGVELLGRSIVFESEDEAKAVVDEDGKVTGVSPGETKIKASIGGSEEAVDLRVVHRFQSIFAGAEHTCGLTALGRAWCWGSNNSGNLGNGDVTRKSQTSPVRVVIDPAISFETMALGGELSCGLTKDRAVWCWGDNTNLALGRDDSTLKISATPLRLDDRSYPKLSVMESAVCGLDDEGFAHCWGLNSSNHELGDPDVDENSATPVAVSAPEGQSKPVAFIELHHGRYHSCGLTALGEAYCWGTNWRGQLGDGTTNSRARPFEPLSGVKVTALGLGAHYTCARTAAETTYCFGDNEYQQVEEGDLPKSELPAERFDETVFVPASFALGLRHGCALDADGRAHCWGSNGRGQLGRSTNEDIAGLGEVEGDLRFKSLVSGDSHVCGLATDGKTYCWGTNYDGELGIGTDGEGIEKPTMVVGQ